MKEILAKTWSVGRWVLLALFVGYLALVGYRIYALGEEEKTAQAVERIHASRLTLADVMGESLPLEPDEEKNNATLAGVDSNRNGIRDDVELVIFEKYKGPSFIKERAAALQYAKALQMEFTEVFNSETLVAVIQEESRGSLCILNTMIDKEIENMVFNTEVRKQYQKEMLQNYMVSYSLPNTEECDISF